MPTEIQGRAEQHRRSYTLAEWCDKRRVSRPMYYKLRSRGLAPKTHNIGTKVLISDDADAAWLRDREAESTTAVIGKSEARQQDHGAQGGDEAAA